MKQKSSSPKPIFTCKTAHGSVEVFRNNNNEYYMHETGRNGKVLQSSETMKRKGNLLKNLLALQKVVNAALKDKKFTSELGGRKA